MNVKDMDILDEYFDEMHDHSKWAVTTGTGYNSQPATFICIGDINRVVSENKLLLQLACKFCRNTVNGTL